jgi:hypothetical protein
MLNFKRLIIAALSGLLFGFVCFSFASSGPNPLPAPIAFQIILSRTLIGFAIGISSFTKIHWSIHGLLFGLIFSLPLAFSGMMAPESPDYNPSIMFTWTVILGMIYGLLIEVITSVIFKAKIQIKAAAA